MKIGVMVWYLGEITDLYEQIAWVKARGFDEVSFHTAGNLGPGIAGFDAANADAAEIDRLRRAVEGFTDVDLHAPFFSLDVILVSPNPRIRAASVATIDDTIRLASRIGAKVITIHEGSSRKPLSEEDEREYLGQSLAALDESATAAGVRVGVELTRYYDLPDALGLENVGLTLDVGHLSFHDGAGYRDYGSIGDLIRAHAPRVYHLHIQTAINSFLCINRTSVNFYFLRSKETMYLFFYLARSPMGKHPSPQNFYSHIV